LRSEVLDRKSDLEAELDITYERTFHAYDREPASAQGKPKFAAAAAGIPDAAHATDVTAQPPPYAAFSIHNNGHLARGLLVMLLLLMLLVKMAIMLTIAVCKSSIYCRQVILKVKMNSMLQS
jgi:hypothetical protein